VDGLIDFVLVEIAWKELMDTLMEYRSLSIMEGMMGDNGII
jgi:hypothetical protein